MVTISMTQGHVKLPKAILTWLKSPDAKSAVAQQHTLKSFQLRIDEIAAAQNRKTTNTTKAVRKHNTKTAQNPERLHARSPKFK
jgi:hypothetical protein